MILVCMKCGKENSVSRFRLAGVRYQCRGCGAWMPLPPVGGGRHQRRALWLFVVLVTIAAVVALVLVLGED